MRDRRIFRGRKRRARSPWVMSLNLTPMIDTVFNMLFLFMIISRFGNVEGMLPAKLPARAVQAAGVSAEIPRTPIVIRLAADAKSPEACRATIDQFNESPMLMRELAAALQRIQKSEAGFDARTPVHLMAQDEIAWDHVVNAYNAALTARYERIFFAGGS